MQQETFDATLLTLKRRRPFQPFTIALVDGDRVEIDHPDAVAVRDGICLFVAPGRVPVFFDHEGVSQIIGDLLPESNE